MTGKWTTKYGLAAVLTAIVIIAVAMFANPSVIPKQVQAKTSFAVMLTDPPTVPAGTTVLNITYSGISLYVTYPNGSSDWISASGSGTVDSFSLVNMSQTIASATVPTNTTVDKIQLTITNASAVINDETYNVTTVSNTLVLSVANSRVNQTLSGVLVDFNPTLVQIQSTDANGNPVNYYVLVPSATAVVVNGIDQAQVHVGTIVKIGQNDRVKISNVVESFADNLTVTSASLSVNGNTTNLSVTLQNNGDVTFRIFDLTLQGNFNSTRDNYFWGYNNPFYPEEPAAANSIPFLINGDSLVPLLGGSNTQPTSNIIHGQMIGAGGMNYGAPDYRPGTVTDDYLVLEPGQSVTLSFSGTLSLQTGIFGWIPSNVITPIVGNTYTISFMGEGFQAFNVTATA